MAEIHFANINQCEFIGKVVKPVEQLKTASGKPCVKMKIETERFVTLAGGKRSRIAQTHNVVITNSLSVGVMASAVPGTIVRIVGELAYADERGNGAEIHVLEYLGQASLMAIVADSAAQKTTENETKKPAGTKPANSGGLGKMNIKKTSQNEVEDGDGDNQDDGHPHEGGVDDFLNSSVFEQSNDLDDAIPF